VIGVGSLSLEEVKGSLSLEVVKGSLSVEEVKEGLSLEVGGGLVGEVLKVA